MGVKSLWSWIDLQPRGSVSRHVVLARSKNSDPAAREATIVVDGFAWMFHLVHVYGGHADMGAVATAAEHEVVALREAGLEPVVVLDGCRSDRKAATTAQRMAQRLRAVQKWVEGLTMPQSNEGEKQHPPHILPMGTTSTVLAVLRACDVRVLVGDHEADGLIESEARNNKSTTVLADDSDFFIADSIGAVASLRSLQVDDDNVQMQVYRPAMVRTALGGLAPDLMPYFSALVGNDYGQLDADVLARVLLALGPPSSNTGIKIRDAIDRVRVVASCLAGFPDAQALLNALANITEPHDLRQAVARLLALADERVQVLTCHDGSTPIAPELLARFRSGRLESVLMDVLSRQRAYMDVLLEDGDQATAWLISQPIRAVAYAVVLEGSSTTDGGWVVCEYLRKGNNALASDMATVTPIALASSAPDHGMGIFRLALSGSLPNDHHHEELERQPWPVYLASVAVRYLLRSPATKMAKWEADAFVFSIVFAAFQSAEPGLYDALFPKRRPTVTRRSLHLFAQLQSTVRSLEMLSSALDRVPPRHECLFGTDAKIASVWVLLSAPLFYTMHERCKRGGGNPFVLTGKTSKAAAARASDVVQHWSNATEALQRLLITGELSFAFPASSAPSTPDLATTKRARRTVGTASTISTSNFFDILRDGCDF